jgi:predicted aspartyl protease
VARAKNNIALQVIKIPPKGMHMIVKVKINNKVAKLVLDTGASQTVLDRNRIERFMKQTKFRKTGGHTSGIGAKKMESHIVPVKKFQVGNIVINDIDLVLLDLIHVNTSYSMINQKPVDGVLGGDILSMLSATISYAKNEVAFKKVKI